MHTLTLTMEERQAIDWVGHRYSNGDDLFDLLQECNEEEWDIDSDITFTLPSNTLAEIAQNARDEDGDHQFNFPCFSDELTDKLRAVCKFA